MADKKRISETATLRLAEQIVARSMPGDWSGKFVQAPGRAAGRRETSLRIRSPDGEVNDFAVVVKEKLDPQSAVNLLDSMGIDATTTLRGVRPVAVVIVAPYLSERARELISARGVSYVDSTGNAHLRSDRPALFISTYGAAKDPWPDDQPLKTLRGRGAGRALRAVVDFRPPFGVRELATRADVATATLARVIDLLAREALLTRDQRGRVTDVDWDRCIRRWSNDYEFLTSNRTTRFLAVRTFRDVTSTLRTVKWRYALTGSLATEPFSQIAPPRQGMLFVDDVQTAARTLDLRETVLGANLLIAEPFDPVVYERTTERDGLTLAAPTQIVADLLTGSGRMPSEGEELLAWMKDNERVWRA